MVSNSKFKHIPLEVVKNPRDGSFVVLDRWWVLDGDFVLGFNISDGYIVPQCNRNESVVDGMVKAREGLSKVFMPIAYWGSFDDVKLMQKFPEK